VTPDQSSRIVPVRATPLLIGSGGIIPDVSVLPQPLAVVDCSEISCYPFAPSLAVLSAPINAGKGAKWAITRSLSLILRFTRRKLAEGYNILVYSSAGPFHLDILLICALTEFEVAFGITLGILAAFFDNKGRLQPLPYPIEKFNKASIRNSLYFLQQHSVEAKIPRFVLGDINRFFLSPTDLMPLDMRLYWTEIDEIIYTQ